jgi:hypothetical protein
MVLLLPSRFFVFSSPPGLNPVPPPPPIVVRAFSKGPDRGGVFIQPTQDLGCFRGAIGRYGSPPHWPGIPAEAGILLSAIGIEQVEQLADALIEAGRALRIEFHIRSDRP